MDIREADALRWAINLADSQKKRDDRSPEERNYLFDLEDMLRRTEIRTDKRAFEPENTTRNLF